MLLVLLARNPTDSVTRGLLPAAADLGLEVRLLTDDPAAHRAVYADEADRFGFAPPTPVGCDVRDLRSVLVALEGGPAPDAVMSNSDHLQVVTALAADYLGLPGKDWRSAARAKDKGLMRAWLHRAGLDDTPYARLPPGGEAPSSFHRFPAVLKPAEGVASEDVVLVRDRAELEREVARIRAHRDGDLLLEGLIDGPLQTLETLGDAPIGAGGTLRVWGGYRTRVSAAPFFIEERLTWDPVPGDVRLEVLAQLEALGVGFGACHTEFIVTADGPRIVEVNDRLIGDHGDFVMADLLGEPVFAATIRVHLGDPPPPRPDRVVDLRAHVHSVVAGKDGVLTEAPGVVERTAADGVRVVYWPLRSVGDRITVTGTNRDYLGQLRVIAPDDETLERVTREFLTDGRWVIE